MPPDPLIPGRDYTIEAGLYVFTADYLRRRGYCCENACRNCPYGFTRQGQLSRTIFLSLMWRIVPMDHPHGEGRSCLILVDRPGPEA